MGLTNRTNGYTTDFVNLIRITFVRLETANSTLTLNGALSGYNQTLMRYEQDNKQALVT